MRVADGYFYFELYEDFQLTKHFNTSEFECSLDSCDETEQRISIELVGCLEAIRREYGEPIYITSGYRTKAYQAKLKERGFETSKKISTHTLGDAVDITTDNIDRLYSHVITFFDAIGVAKTFLHVDIRRDKLRKWTYERR